MKRGRDQSIEEEDEEEGDERAKGARHEDPTNEDFVSRVSHFPLVNSALRVYEHSKASSRVVKVRFFPFLSFLYPSRVRGNTDATRDFFLV